MALALLSDEQEPISYDLCPDYTGYLCKGAVYNVKSSYLGKSPAVSDTERYFY